MDNFMKKMLPHIQPRWIMRNKQALQKACIINVLHIFNKFLNID